MGKSLSRWGFLCGLLVCLVGFFLGTSKRLDDSCFGGGDYLWLGMFATLTASHTAMGSAILCRPDFDRYNLCGRRFFLLPYWRLARVPLGSLGSALGTAGEGQRLKIGRMCPGWQVERRL